MPDKHINIDIKISVSGHIFRTFSAARLGDSRARKLLPQAASQRCPSAFIFASSSLPRVTNTRPSGNPLFSSR